MTDETILSVENLAMQFRTGESVIPAVDGVSFDVREGEIVGLVGESGAGKSATAKSILRVLDDAGEIVDGRIRYRDRTLVDATEEVDADGTLSEEEMRREVRGSEIAIIFQDPMEALNPVYPVGNQIREFVELNRDLGRDAAKDEAVRMLREVGIPDPASRYDDYPHELSGGMRQRVLIAMAMGCRPDLIIADEPTTALDVTVEGQIIDIVRDLQSKYGTSFVWVTHDMGVIAEICDRVNVMYLGRIVEQGPVDDIFHETKHPYTKALLESIPRPDRTVAELHGIPGTMPAPSNPPAGCRFHTRCPDAREACRQGEPATVAFDDPSHRASCLKHGGEEYEDSEPLAPGDRAVAGVEIDDAPDEPLPGEVDRS